MVRWQRMHTNASRKIRATLRPSGGGARPRPSVEVHHTLGTEVGAVDLHLARRLVLEDLVLEEVCAVHGKTPLNAVHGEKSSRPRAARTHRSTISSRGVASPGWRRGARRAPPRARAPAANASRAAGPAIEARRRRRRRPAAVRRPRPRARRRQQRRAAAAPPSSYVRRRRRRWRRGGAPGALTDRKDGLRGVGGGRGRRRRRGGGRGGGGGSTLVDERAVLADRPQPSHCGDSPQITAPCVIMKTWARYRARGAGAVEASSGMTVDVRCADFENRLSGMSFGQDDAFGVVRDVLDVHRRARGVRRHGRRQRERRRRSRRGAVSPRATRSRVKSQTW